MRVDLPERSCKHDDGNEPEVANGRGLTLPADVPDGDSRDGPSAAACFATSLPRRRIARSSSRIASFRTAWRRVLFAATIGRALHGKRRSRIEPPLHQGYLRGCLRLGRGKTGLISWLFLAPSPLRRLACPPADRDQDGRQAKHGCEERSHAPLRRKEPDGDRDEY